MDALPQDVVVLLAVDGGRTGAGAGLVGPLPLARALAGGRAGGLIVEVPTLDGRLVPVTQIVAPGETKVVPGEGTPAQGPDGEGRPDLKFEIKFPKTLTPRRRPPSRRLK